MTKKPETVENVLDEMDRATLASAMALAFSEIQAATKDAENPAFKQGGKASKYANLGAVIEAVKPALIKHGLFFTQHCHPSDDGVSVETVLHHRNGESLSLGTLYVPANKRDPQGFGSALTYARRYGLQTGFGVPTEDDDGNAAVASVRAQAASVEPISDNDFERIKELAPKAGKSLEDLCAAYKVDGLKNLTAEQGRACIARLGALANGSGLRQQLEKSVETA